MAVNFISPEHGFAGEGLQHRGGCLLVGEEEDLGLADVCRQELVHLRHIREPNGQILQELCDLGDQRLGFQLAFELESRDWVHGVDHHRRGLLDVLLLAEGFEFVAINGADSGHALELLCHIVVLLQHSLVCLAIVPVEPHGAHRGVSELADDAVKIDRRDALDVMLHGLDGEGISNKASAQAGGKQRGLE